MSTQSPLPQNDPVLIAFQKLKHTPEYRNAVNWTIKAENEGQADGELWFAFLAGYDTAALSLLQWKDVADGLPEVEGQYSVVKGSGKTPFYLTFPKAEDKSAYAQIVRMMWAEEIAAYIPVPIPEWKEQR